MIYFVLGLFCCW